jgi:hypothetical protein
MNAVGRTTNLELHFAPLQYLNFVTKLLLLRSRAVRREVLKLYYQNGSYKIRCLGVYQFYLAHDRRSH